VKPGTYNIVAYADGKTPDFIKITTKPGEVLEDDDSVDFELVDEGNTETVTGMVTISGADDNEQFATLSFRQNITCTDCVDGEMIEVKSVNILNMRSYSEDLTPGDYTLVASTYGLQNSDISDYILKIIISRKGQRIKI
jgi:hypothetical protein